MPNMESTSPEFEFDGRHFNIESSIFLPPITETELQAFLQTGVCNSKFKVEDHGDEFHAQKPASELHQHQEIISDLIPSPLSMGTRPSLPSESLKSSGSMKKKEERKHPVAQPRYRDRQRKGRISKEVAENIGHTPSPVSQLPRDWVLESKQTQMSEKCKEFLGTPYVIPPTIEELEQVREMCKYEQDAVDAIAKITSDLESEGPELDGSLNMNMEIKEEAIADILMNKTPISLINEEACLSIAENDPLNKSDFVYDPSEKFHQGSLWGLFAVSFQMNEAHQFAAHTREDMKQQFSEFGEVARVNIAKDVDGKRGFIVWFAEEKAAKNAIQNLRNVYHGIKLKNNTNTLLKSSNNGRSIELNASLCFNNKLGIPIDKISEEWKKFGDVEVINLATSKRSKKSRREVYICFKNAVEMNAAMQHFIFKDEKYPDLDLATSPIGAKCQERKADLISKEVGEMIGQIIKLIEASTDAGNDVTELCNVKEQNRMETPKGKWLKDSISINGGKKFKKKQLNCGRQDTIPRAPPNTPSTSLDQITGIKTLSSLNDTKVEGNRTRKCDDKDHASISPIATSTPVPSKKDIHTSYSQTKLETVKENEIFVNSDRSVDMKSSLVQADQTIEDGSSILQTSVEVDVPTLLEVEISNSLNAERSEIARRELIQITKMLKESQAGVDGHSVNPRINEEEVGQQLTPIPSPSANPHPFFAFPSPGAEAKMLLPLATASEGQVKPESPLFPTLKKAQLNIHLNAKKEDGQPNTPASSPSSENGKVDSIESYDESGLLFHPKAASDSFTRTNLSRSPISGGHLPLDEKDLELSPVVSPIHPLPKLDAKTDSSGGCCFSFGSPFSPLVSSPKSRNEAPLASPNISIFKSNLDSTSLSLISLNDEVPTSEALDEKSYHTDHNSNVEKSSTSETIGLMAEATPHILPDIFGRYGLVMCGFGTGTNAQIEEIREDFDFFGDVVSLAWRTNACIVKFADMEPAKAAFVGLREKYKHLRPFQPSDIGPDRLGRFTLTFLDTKGKKYVGTKEEFFKYGEKSPLIAKGEGKFLIRVSYSDKKGALDAFIANASNPDFPELQIAPECEVSPLSCDEDSQETLGSQNSSCLSTTNETFNEERTDDFKLALKYETDPVLYYQKVFDSHCHIDLMFKVLKKRINWSNFKSKKPDCYNQNWSGCITVMCDPSTWSKNLHILLEPDVWAVVGCHPKLAARFTADKLEEMRNLIEVNEKIRAVGEIGLDAGHEDKCKFEDQEKTFRKCLEMAVEMDKPICLHVKGRMEEARQIMREVGVKKNHKIHFHCWGRTDNWEVCQDLLCEYPNLKVGITPLVTFASAANVHDVATRLPLDRMLLETDSPYFYPRLADKKLQTRCSHPGLVIHGASQVALLKGISVEDVLAANRKNVEAVYGI